jgi:hypothetical protein
MKKSRNQILIMLLLFSIQVFAQERVVVGTVVDENKIPLPGVNVLVQNTTIGTITDLDGNFSLSIPDDDDKILVFSSIGFTTQEVMVGDKEVFNIT